MFLHLHSHNDHRVLPIQKLFTATTDTPKTKLRLNYEFQTKKCLD